MELSDKDILTDMLMGTKMLSMGYHTAVLEAANDRVRNTLIQINNEELNTQKQIFEHMHARGWYMLDPAFTGTPMGADVTGIRPETGPAGPRAGTMGPPREAPGQEFRNW